MLGYSTYLGKERIACLQLVFQVGLALVGTHAHKGLGSP